MINRICSAKYVLIYAYGVFMLNIISIFYMDRANNSLDSKVEFLATLILPIFIAFAFVRKNSKLSTSTVLLASVGLIIGGPLVFFAHVALTL